MCVYLKNKDHFKGSGKRPIQSLFLGCLEVGRKALTSPSLFEARIRANRAK